MKSKALIAMMCALSLAACASTQKQLEKQRERDPKYQYNLGLVHLNNPQISASSLDEAIRYFDKALSLDPRLYLAWNARGLALTMRGDLSGAIRSFEKCLEINPAFSEAHNNLGSIYESQGLLSKAEEAFKKPLADKSYPTKELPLYNLARMAFLQEKYETALDYVQQSIAANKRLAMAHNLKGLVFQKMDLLPDAVASFEQAVKLVPDDMNFQFNLAVACFDCGDKQRADEILSKVLDKTTDQELRERVLEYKKKIKE